MTGDSAPSGPHAQAALLQCNCRFCTRRVVQDTGVLQMVIDDTVMEALESDNLTLQTMSGGKYVQVRGTRPLCYLFHTAHTMQAHR